jgi:two-component system nitrogen regulation response regulator NtrX
MTDNTTGKNILIVDDEADIRNLIRGILEDEGYHIREASNSNEALEAINTQVPDLMILDIWLQEGDSDGIQILETVKKQHELLPVIMISGHGTIETAVNAIKKGAYDFIEKPFKSDRLFLMMDRAFEAAALKRENKTLKAQNNTQDHELIGCSPFMLQLKAQIEKIAPTNSRVFITGEGGTGKEVVAKTIHKLSQRHHAPFMVLNCASLNPEHLEKELFGVHKDGHVQKGMLEMANGGTLFLDEIADMPLETQAKILRVLQDNKITPVGSQDTINIDVRFLASTNKNPQDLIEKGDFREDLFYRLNVVTLNLVPLRKRPDDVEPLVTHFLERFAGQMGQAKRVLSTAAFNKLHAYDWPGNVRQLKNMMEWITIMTPSPEQQDELSVEDLPPEFSNSYTAERREDRGVDYLEHPLRQARENFEKAYLTAQIKRFNGNVSQTAEFIGMERSALHRKLKSLDISLNDTQNANNDNKAQVRA